MTTPPLSPAQLVKKAATDAYWLFHPGQAAALLVAVADQVVPEAECESPDQEEWIGQSAWAQCCYSKRHRLLALAAELRQEM
jgi:hypothetical protein